MSENVLEAYGGAVIALDKDEMKATLADWIHRFQTSRPVCGPIDEQVVRSFSSGRRAEELQETLEEAIARS
ncbi:MAG: hypothetical protein IIC82_04720 [Chloroflexi bacterium]|nr:hypothetical protein [Chloroflexota bacterium]